MKNFTVFRVCFLIALTYATWKLNSLFFPELEYYWSFLPSYLYLMVVGFLGGIAQFSKYQQKKNPKVSKMWDTNSYLILYYIVAPCVSVCFMISGVADARLIIPLLVPPILISTIYYIIALYNSIKRYITVLYVLIPFVALSILLYFCELIKK